MTKRYIVMLAPVLLVDENDEPIRMESGAQQQVAHADFIRGRTMDATFGESLDGICAAAEIRRKVRGLGEGDVLELDEDEWQLLLAATVSPRTAKYHALVGPQITRQALAVRHASSERPAPLKQAAE